MVMVVERTPDHQEGKIHEHTNGYPRQNELYNRAWEGRLMEETIRTILAKYGHLAVAIDKLSDDDDLYQVGMTSHASIDIMLALEAQFEVEFPEAMLRRRTFESVNAIQDAVDDLMKVRAS
jgi:acyl carrier protein